VPAIGVAERDRDTRPVGTGRLDHDGRLAAARFVEQGKTDRARLATLPRSALLAPCAAPVRLNRQLGITEVFLGDHIEDQGQAVRPGGDLEAPYRLQAILLIVLEHEPLDVAALRESPALDQPIGVVHEVLLGHHAAAHAPVRLPARAHAEGPLRSRQPKDDIVPFG